MIKKGLALEAAGLREDELELEVPSDLVAGRLGGAHSLQRISGRALCLAARVDLWEEALSAEAFCCRPGLIFSLRLAVFGPSRWMRRAVRPGSRALVFWSAPAAPRCPS